MTKKDDLDPLKGPGSTPTVCHCGGVRGCVCEGGQCMCSDGCVCDGKCVCIGTCVCKVVDCVCIETCICSGDECVCSGKCVCKFMMCGCKGRECLCNNTPIEPSSPGYISLISGRCISCPATKNPPKNDDILKCKTCPSTFHVDCCSFGQKSYLKSVIKLISNGCKNVSFLCDPCQTRQEVNLSAAKTKRVDRLEARLASVEHMLATIPSLSSKLDTISQKLDNSPAHSVPIVSMPSTSTVNTSAPALIPNPQPAIQPPTNTDTNTSNSSWPKIRTPPPKSTFLIKPIDGQTPPLSKSEIGEIALKNSIPLFSTSTDGKGNTFVSLATANIPTFKSLVEKVLPQPSNGSSNNNAKTVLTLKQKNPSIVIVGLDQKYEASELFGFLKSVNDFGHFMSDTSFKVLTVKPLKNNSSLFQAVCNVSEDIRTMIHKSGDKVHFGPGVLKIYDHFYVRRCSLCQGLNHYSTDKSGHSRCKSGPICAICGQNHITSNCTATDNHSAHCCVNCKRNNLSFSHRADSPSCESYKMAQDKLKSQIEWYKSNDKPSNF